MTTDTKITNDLQLLIDAGNEFATIYADPPWQYENQGTRGATDDHYHTMTVSEIAEMPVKSLASNNAHLHLWTTNGFLFEAKEIMESWGFEYKSCFIWIKPRIGMGNYWRVSHEFMLFGLRGKLPFRSHNKRSWIQVDTEDHSNKPWAVREMIEEVSYGPYLELFGRKPATGWTVFGNQIELSMFDNDVERIENENIKIG